MEVREELSNEKKDVKNEEKQPTHEELSNEQENVKNEEKHTTREEISSTEKEEKQTTHEELSNEKENVKHEEKHTTHEKISNEKEDVKNEEKQTTHEELNNKKEDVNNEEKQTTHEQTTREEVSNEMEDDFPIATWREEAPTQYILEIESLPIFMKILSQSKLNRYESSEFEVSGYNWRLILEFEEEVNPGKGDYQYLSFKLQIMDNECSVDALINLLLHVYDEDYINIRAGKVKQFKKEKKEWGLYRRAPLEFFLAYQETFKVGVEIFVLRNEGKGECFTTLTDHFVWKMEKFSEMKQISLSQDFTIGDYKWKLRLYPRGVPKVKEEYLSIYLFLQDSENVPIRSKICVDFKLRINDQHGVCKCNSNRIQKSGNAWFSRSANVWGFPYFIKLADLKERKGLIVDDSLIFGAEISSISISKDLPPNTL